VVDLLDLASVTKMMLQMLENVGGLNLFHANA
jgi:hypothetical protein